MHKKNNISLFIFRRDLRLDDNTGLLKALRESEYVIPCFIFDPRQIESDNSYKSDRAVHFMYESLKELELRLKKIKGELFTFYGIAEQIVKELLQKNSIDAVYINKDYTPFSIKRDSDIAKICAKLKREFVEVEDLLLNAIAASTKNDGAPYTVFTPFFKKTSLNNVNQPVANKHTNFYTFVRSEKQFHIPHTPHDTLIIKGGSTEGHKILNSLKQFKDYAKTRDFPEKQTTHLSVHLKFGTVSVREAYYAIASELGHNSPLIRQLYWRDFYTLIAYHFPRVFGKAFIPKYNEIKWSENKEHFVRWCTGTTGFPIVDAGMRELNVTGFMHNRVRMIVASFLVKDLHINWQWGEKYFAQQLIDYDPAVNNGNWQWAASTGCDPQPYFRIFNPWLQQKKFDPECTYIKRWVPELKNELPKHIHTLYKYKAATNYPSPIVDHTKEAATAKNYFKSF